MIRWKNFRKIILRIGIVIFFTAGFECMARFCYESWNSYTLTSKRERRELKGTLDTLYCGTSLAARAFKPVVLDELLGTDSFNLATNSQPVKGTYYLIRETAEENPLKQVNLALSIASLKEEAVNWEYLSAYENMRTLRWKIRYLCSIGNEQMLVSSLMYATRVEEYLNLEKVKTNVKNKLRQKKVKKYYGQRGWRASKKYYQGTDAVKQNSPLNYWDPERGADQINGEVLEYLYKIGEFCKEEGIELNLIFLPVTQDYIDGAGDLDNMNSICRKIAGDLGAGYYNFMLYKERKTVFTDDKFGDTKHFNVDGGPVFSELFAEVMQSSHPQDYFFDSISDFEGR